MREPYLDVARKAAFEAGKILKDHFGRIKPHDIDEKAKDDYVTYVDRLAEETIKNIIRSFYPEHSFLAEESGSEERKAGYLWVIDPLDGTKNYIHAYPVFSISIALLIEGEVIMGLIYDPMRDDFFWATKGGGAFRNGKRIEVTHPENLRGTLLATGFPHRAKDRIDPYLVAFKELFLKASAIRRAGSAALDLAYVACGIFDGFFEFGLSPWDVAAGTLIVKEAGGVVTDFRGGENYLKTGNIIAAPPEIHREILLSVRRAFGDMP